MLECQGSKGGRCRRPLRLLWLHGVIIQPTASTRGRSRARLRMESWSSTSRWAFSASLTIFWYEIVILNFLYYQVITVCAARERHLWRASLKGVFEGHIWGASLRGILEGQPWGASLRGIFEGHLWRVDPTHQWWEDLSSPFSFFIIQMKNESDPTTQAGHWLLRCRRRRRSRGRPGESGLLGVPISKLGGPY